MPDPRPRLDYANAPRRARWSDGQCAIFTVACCFGCSWLFWFVLGIGSNDPYEDDPILWAFLLAVPCGLLLSPIAVTIVLVLRPRNNPP